MSRTSCLNNGFYFLFMPVDNGNSDLTSSQSSLRALTVLISLLRRSATTAAVFPWSVQWCFFFRRTKNCSTVTTPLEALGDTLNVKRIISNAATNSVRLLAQTFGYTRVLLLNRRIYMQNLCLFHGGVPTVQCCWTSRFSYEITTWASRKH